MVCVVDEETGGGEGAVWLTENHPDAVRCDMLLNEGAGAVFPFGDERVYGVCVAEKGVFRFTVTTEGVAGHASTPQMGDNALLKMVPFLQAMGDRQPPYDVTETPRALLAELGLPLDGDRRPCSTRCASATRSSRCIVEPMLGVTLAPTRIFASEKINVIPSRARARGRLPHAAGDGGGRGPRAHRGGPRHQRLRARVHREGGRQLLAAATSPLMDALRGWVAREDPEARVVPTMLPAFTDSRTFRAAFPECVAYGFFPQREMNLYETWPLVHSRDERIATADLGFAARCYRDVTKELLGG